jgi:beta-glucosidase
MPNSVRLEFPTGFLWGAATSAHQVEGGNRWNDWWRFEQQSGAIASGDASGDACRHYERFDEDFALAAADRHRMHRLSLEWSRIQPEEGRVDEAALAHYHEVFASLRRHAILPLVTLHHFTNPLWIADQGGWENPRTIDHFCDFVRICAREYGGEVDWWCTINEPEVYAFRSYSEGLWPPRKRDDGAALVVIGHLLEAHGRAYRILHAEDRVDADGDGHPARVGFAKYHPILEPARRWFPPDVLRARIEHRVFNEAVLQAPLTGRIALSIPGVKPVLKGSPDLERSLDFLGLNYYTRWMVQMFATEAHVARPGAAVTDLGWEIYPAGLEQVLLRLAPLGVPVLVTENGYADAADTFRPRALIETLVHLKRAMDRGAPAIGYLHWSLLDNFEWADGYRGRFGLYRVDFGRPDRPRARTRSAALYARVLADNAITGAVLAEAGLDGSAAARAMPAPRR